MIAYHYDDQGYFSGLSIAQKNPIKTREFLLPSNATFVAVPDESTYTADQTPLFNEDLEQWQLVDSPAKVDADNAKWTIENSYGVSLYKDDGNGNPVPRDQKIVDSETQAIIDSQNFSVSTNELRETMDGNILTKAAEVTKGTSIDSINAFVQSFHLRANNPSEYVNAGLKVYYANGTHNVGDDLDTEAKISEYYKNILVELDLFREAEIAAFVAARNAL